MRTLPEAVVALRERIFAAVNGSGEITLPRPGGGPEEFERLYASPHADGRSRGAALSDLFWYWLAPGPQVHQEHLEPGPRYDEVARCTRRILSAPTARIEALAAACTEAVLAGLPAGPVTRVRLRDLFMPVWAAFFHELVFEEPCPPEARDLITANADDVVSSLKCTSLRHMRRRRRLTAYLLRRLDDVPHELPAALSRQERAWYLQGAFFNTAVVQSSEGMAHLLLALAQHPDVQARAAAGTEPRYLNHVLEETLRQYPLFGIAHRITSAEVDGIPAGTVLCFNYAAYERSGQPDPDVFDPDRWDGLAVKDAHHIPFGVPANRSCPAWRLSPIGLLAAARTVLDRYELRS